MCEECTPVICRDCGESSTDATEVHNGFICSDCWHTNDWDRCDSCNFPRHGMSRYRDDGNSRICGICAARYFTQCPGCDYYYSDSLGYCENCDYGNQSSYSHLIYDYSYRPLFNFLGEGPLYLGFELEVEAERGLPELAEMATGYLNEDSDGRQIGYLKEDGSLSNGFEIVTHPMGFDYAITKFPWGLLGELAQNGAYTTAGTGLHVHLSRSGFSSPSHIYNWLEFFYRNRVSVETIARRSGSSWARFDPDDRRRFKKVAKGSYGYQRYSAINCLNDETFEVRVFRGSLEAHEVKAGIGLAVASAEYTRQIRAHEVLKHGAWEWPAFYDWAQSKPEYEALTDAMSAMGSESYQRENLLCAC